MYAFLLTTVLLAAPQAPAATPPDAEMCLSCHSDPQMSITAADGTLISMHVNTADFAQSVHAKLACADCHTGKTEVPHEPRTIRTRRDLTLAYDEQCRRCHFTNYTKTLDSVHQAAVARGDRTAPVCVDCHGSHDIRTPAQPRARISETCAKCHQGVATAYAKSVHGRGLTNGGAADVPVCTDCHRSHDIGGPHQQQWELSTPDLCGRCHADETLMKKYGLSTAVLSTYLADFHGKTASLRQHQGTTPNGRVVARCTDCHGVHDIEKADAPSSPVMKANLQKTCRKCHDDTNANFPDAWLSHYEPSWSKAPVVYGVKVAYALLIPFMIGGLGLQILLHLWRLMVNR
jgi:predicted CXXCH cytochrome family protein